MDDYDVIREINLERATICLDVLRGMRACDKFNIYDDKYLDIQASLLELIELIEES
jgi:hypothetical protein